VTLARLDGIPTRAHGNEEPFVLFEIISHAEFVKFEPVTRRIGTSNYLFYLI